MTERKTDPQGGYYAVSEGYTYIEGVLLERPFELIIRSHPKVFLFK